MTAVTAPGTEGISGFRARNCRWYCLSGLIFAIRSRHSLLMAPELPVKGKGLPLKPGGSQNATADQSPASTSSAPSSAPS